MLRSTLTVHSRLTSAVLGRRRAPWAVAMVAGLLCVLSVGQSPAWAASAAQFDPAASSATWDGDTVRVTFLETGVPPGSTSTIAIEATVTVDAVCRQDDNVQVSIHSSATATDVSEYPSGADATIRGSREFAVTVPLPTISGLGCTTQITRTLTVVLRDLDTGATLVLP